MFDPPTNRPRDIPTQTKCPQNFSSTVNNLLLGHLDPMTISHCNILTRSGRIVHPLAFFVQLGRIHPVT